MLRCSPGLLLFGKHTFRTFISSFVGSVGGLVVYEGAMELHLYIKRFIWSV